MVDRQFVNVIVLGFAFMFIFTSFQTGSMIQTVVIKSIGKIDTSYHGDGYASLCIIYAVLAICNWLAPSVLTYIGPKFAMIVGGLTYAVFISNFLYPVTWVLYLVSVLIGIGAALIWTGQGNFLTINSNTDTMSRNSGIFWAMLQCSLLFGNIFMYFELKGESIIQIRTINTVFGGLLGVCCVGIILLFLLRTSGQGSLVIRKSDDEPEGAVAALVKAFEMFKTRDMILLSFTFFYTGLELSFFSGVYGTCITYTGHFGTDAAKFVGISGIFIGAGEIIGGATFGILGKKTNKYGRDPIVLLGYIVHMTAFYLIFLNLPSMSVIRLSYEPTYITSNIYLAIVCSFMLGFGDACFNTQIYSILGGLYSDNSAPAFALFKFVQSIAAAGAFFYSGTFNLHLQLLIMVIFGTIGSFCFFIVEWKAGSASSVISKETRTTSVN